MSGVTGGGFYLNVVPDSKAAPDDGVYADELDDAFERMVECMARYRPDADLLSMVGTPVDLR